MAIVKRIFQSPLVRGSVLIFIANNAASFGNFLYNLFMGRLLTPQQYGDLGAILSLLALLSVPIAVFQLLIVKAVSSYWGGNKKGLVYLLFQRVTPKLFIFGLIFTLILLFMSPQLANFLHIGNILPWILIALSMLLSFPSAFNKSILQGTLSFNYITLNSFIEVGLKLLVSILLVVFNFGLMGALIGPFFGGLTVYLFTIFQLRIILHFVRSSTGLQLPKWLTWKTVLPVLVSSLTLTIFFTSDVILVRHFFSPAEAGEYVAISTIGRIIYFAIGPVISVMFPLISSRVNMGISYILPLLGTLVMSLAISGILTFINFLAPKLVLTLFYGGKFYGAVPYLGIFSFFISLYSLNSIMTYFLLSISHYKPLYYLFGITLLQSILIILFHNTIYDVIWVNIGVSLLYLLVISTVIIKKEKYYIIYL